MFERRGVVQAVVRAVEVAGARANGRRFCDLGEMEVPRTRRAAVAVSDRTLGRAMLIVAAAGLRSVVARGGRAGCYGRTLLREYEVSGTLRREWLRGERRVPARAVQRHRYTFTFIAAAEDSFPRDLRKETKLFKYKSKAL